jgi:hypothetical protein
MEKVNQNFRKYFRMSQETVKPLEESLGATAAEVNAEAAVQAASAAYCDVQKALSRGDISEFEFQEMKEEIFRKVDVLNQRPPLRGLQEKHRRKNG